MLSRLEGEPVRRRLVAWDLEWYPETLKLRLAGAYDPIRGYRAYRTIAEFLRGELTSDSRGCWFMAHAGGLYDIQWVLEELIDNPKPGLSVEALFSGSSAVIVKLTRGRNCWWFIDSYWLLRAPLREIAKWFGMEKGGAEDSTDVFHAPWNELRDYNEKDCRILFTALDGFEEHLLDLGGQMQMTLASSAMYLFRRRFLLQDIPTADAINSWASVAYAASRVEVLHYAPPSGGNIFDINSSFPYAMSLGGAPGPLLGMSHGRLPGPGVRYIADVDIEIPEQIHPPLAWRNPQSYSLFFPFGRWRSWFTDTDIELALEQGAIIHSVGDVARFQPIDDLAPYAEFLYEKRRVSTDEAERAIYKLLMNGLYGKFAEQEEKTSLLIAPKETAGLVMLRPGVFLRTESRDIPHRHVPFAAHITSVARRTLYRGMQQAGDVWYCDTDSVFTPSDLPRGDALGAWKYEGSFKRLRPAHPKLYAYEKMDGSWKVKAKGFPKLSYESFCDLMEGRELELKRFVRVRENMRSGDSTPREMDTTKKILGTARPKRARRADGSTRPWHVDELDAA